MCTRYGNQKPKQTFIQGKLLEQLEPQYSGSKAGQSKTGPSKTDPSEADQMGEILFSMIKNGICYMLSIEWIRQLTEKPGEHPASIFDNDFSSRGNLGYFKQIANNYCMFSASYGYTFFSAVSFYPSAAAIPETGKSYMECTDRQFTGLCSKDKMQVESVAMKSPADQPGKLFASLPKEHGMLLWLQVYESMKDSAGKIVMPFAHEMALWRTAEDVLYFFDPNEGVFEVNDPDQLAEEIFSYTGSPQFPIITSPWLFVSEIQASPKKDTGAK